MRASLAIILLGLLPFEAAALSCELNFTVLVTHGVGDIRPGTELVGRARFTTEGSFRQEGGSTAHLATGEMQLGDAITGPVWTLITTSRDFSADLVGVYAHEVSGLSFAGTSFQGPMALTLYGPAGTRPEPVPPVTQAEWDALDLRRSFQLHAGGSDMLAGDVVALLARCN